MKSTQQSTERQKQPTNPGNAVNSPAILKNRTSSYLPGAFLLIALITVVAYGAPKNDSSSAAIKDTVTSQQAQTPKDSNPLTISQPANDQSNPKDTAMNEKKQSTNVSTSIVNNNGETTVTVNGEKVAIPEDGSVSKTVTTDNGGTVQVNVSQGNGTSTNSSINSFNSSFNSYSSFSSGSTNMNSGN